MTLFRAVLIVLMVAVLAACATKPPTTKPTIDPTPEPRTQPEDHGLSKDQSQAEPETEDKTEKTSRKAIPRTAAQASGKAAMSLLHHGKQLASSGMYKQASANIERALNIEPRNAFIYQRLAELRMQQGMPEQAGSLARKANSLAGNNPYLRAQNWALISQALQAQGKYDLADSAAQKAEQLRTRVQ